MMSREGEEPISKMEAWPCPLYLLFICVCVSCCRVRRKRHYRQFVTWGAGLNAGETELTEARTSVCKGFWEVEAYQTHCSGDAFRDSSAAETKSRLQSIKFELNTKNTEKFKWRSNFSVLHFLHFQQFINNSERWFPTSLDLFLKIYFCKQLNIYKFLSIRQRQNQVNKTNNEQRNIHQRKNIFS